MHFKPTTPADMHELKEFGPKTLDGIFFGYEEFAGGDFSGNCYVASWNQFNNAQAATEINLRTIVSHNVKPLTSEGRYIFPLRAGMVSQPISSGERRGTRDKKSKSIIDCDLHDEETDETFPDDK